MNSLEIWLATATRGLSPVSAAQVNAEISDHYAAAREAALTQGEPVDIADVSALAVLGDAKSANRQYRSVLLTSLEARLMRDDNVEARALRTANSWFRWPLLVLSMGALMAAAALYKADVESLARVALALGIGTIFWLAVPLLPIYTSSRGRVFRGLKWLVQAGTLFLAFGPGGLRMPWLIVLCLVQLSWMEWKRASIRRKLPVSQWPKKLFL